eukprot:TRINITY_DN77234_c0_g1_i1.p1 TRINITY_DN77234_c0_g1~~TRINITY_DN77234_c0_g1_i1.p1  ORF type:complete len:384 (-),score=51.97 TRINITY_DN77234_c0_g1_i1:470-1621(-)
MTSASECPVCWDTVERPKLLKCLHTICRDCLAQIKEANEAKMVFSDEITCPICREKTTIPMGDCLSLPSFAVAPTQEKVQDEEVVQITLDTPTALKELAADYGIDLPALQEANPSLTNEFTKLPVGTPVMLPMLHSSKCIGGPNADENGKLVSALVFLSKRKLTQKEAERMLQTNDGLLNDAYKEFAEEEDWEFVEDKEFIQENRVKDRQQHQQAVKHQKEQKAKQQAAAALQEQQSLAARRQLLMQQQQQALLAQGLRAAPQPAYAQTYTGGTATTQPQPPYAYQGYTNTTPITTGAQPMYTYSQQTQSVQQPAVAAYQLPASYATTTTRSGGYAAAPTVHYATAPTTTRINGRATRRNVNAAANGALVGLAVGEIFAAILS